MSQNEFVDPPLAFGHSSKVELFLLTGNQTHSLAQIGPDFIILREPIDLPPGDAEVVMRINGKETRWPVTLLHGAVPFDRRVETADR